LIEKQRSSSESKASTLATAFEEAAEKTTEAKYEYRRALRSAEYQHEEQTARVEKDFRKARGNIRAARRAAKHARNRVFRRFLETGNEAQACEELEALIRAFESSNVS
jgi:hypothetical protein